MLYTIYLSFLLGQDIYTILYILYMEFTRALYTMSIELLKQALLTHLYKNSRFKFVLQ